MHIGQPILNGHADPQLSTHGSNEAAKPREVARNGVPDHPLPLGSVRGIIAIVNPLLEPGHHFILDPSHPALAEPHPLRELPGCLKACDVLRRIEDQLL